MSLFSMICSDYGINVFTYILSYFTKETRLILKTVNELCGYLGASEYCSPYTTSAFQQVSLAAGPASDNEVILQSMFAQHHDGEL
jgi:hypothetical protein